VNESFDWDSLTFSLTPTETMYITTTEGDEPWMPGQLQPYGDIPMSPAAGVLNYGQGLFEGMKAFRTSKERIVFFRPEENARRMQRGADRLRCRRYPNPFSSMRLNKWWVRTSIGSPPAEGAPCTSARC
jgi:branched-chain amino acid aminotransferase